MWNMYLSMVEMERILMCGFHTMTSSIAAVPGILPKYLKSYNDEYYSQTQEGK